MHQTYDKLTKRLIWDVYPAMKRLVGVIICFSVVPKYTKQLTAESVISNMSDEPVEAFEIRKVRYLALKADHLWECARCYMLLQVGIRAKYYTAKYDIDALNMSVIVSRYHKCGDVARTTIPKEYRSAGLFSSPLR